jgi:hypothetical protein
MCVGRGLRLADHSKGVLSNVLIRLRNPNRGSMFQLQTTENENKYVNAWCSELSSGLYCRVKWLSTDVSEVRTASIIRDNHFTRHYNPEDSSEHHTRRRENLKSHMLTLGYLTAIVNCVSSIANRWWVWTEGKCRGIKTACRYSTTYWWQLKKSHPNNPSQNQV